MSSEVRRAAQGNHAVHFARFGRGPALRIQRITRDTRDNLIEAEQSTFRSDRYRMVFMRKR